MVMKLEFHCSLQNTSILVALDSKGLVILNVTNFFYPTLPSGYAYIALEHAQY